MSDTVTEARELIEIIDIDEVKNNKEKLFVLSMENYVQLGEPLSPRQIYWLRDIKDKQLEG